MKDIHPKYYENAKVICGCGNTFTVGSTIPEIHVEICNKCHPFYTGEQKLVDTEGMVEKFQRKAKKSESLKKKAEERTKKAEAKKKEAQQKPKTLKEMLKVARER